MNDEFRNGVYYLPENFENEFSLMGYNIPLLNLIEACVAVLTIIGLEYFILSTFYLPFISGQTAFIIGGVLSFAVGIACITGVNGNSLGQYILLALKFRRKRRTAYYNKRVKTEIKPSYVVNTTEDMMPRDKMIKMYNDFMANRSAKHQSEAMIQTDLGDNVYFKDDIGVVEAPDEYLTDKELKKKKKDAKKKAKQEQREKRKAEKGVKKNDRSSRKRKKEKDVQSSEEEE